jgi:hypothetical protein
MKKLAGLFVMCAVMAISAPAFANVTYGPTMVNAKDASGNLIADGTYSMFIDLNGDGWNGNSYLSQSAGDPNHTSWLWDTNDLLLDVGQITGGEAYTLRELTTAQLPATYNAGVDQYYLLWFNTPYNSAAAGPGAGISYGAASLGTVGADPGTYTPDLLAGNTNLLTTGGNPLVTPEPISCALMAIGAGVMGLRRRFNGVKV